MFENFSGINMPESQLLPFEMGYLPEYFVRKAEIELFETPKAREQALRQLREIISNDINLSGLFFDDAFLLQFLRARKFNIQKALFNLKSFVVFRKKEASIFLDIRFDAFKITIQKKIFNFLPYRCPDGCAILLIHLDNWDPREFGVPDVKRMIALHLLQATADPMTQVNGFKVIFDVKSNPIKHLRYATPHHLHLIYHGSQECLPGRFKGVHFVNQSLTFKVAWVLVKHFLSEKLKKRIHIHANAEPLLNYFPESILPVELGGQLKDYDQTDWLRRAASPENLATLYRYGT